MAFSDVNFVYGAYFPCILALAIACAAHVYNPTQREVLCPESNFVVNLQNKTTSIKIIRDNGDTLFSIDSTSAQENDIDILITYLNSLIFPEEGVVLNRNHSDFVIVKHPLFNGIQINIFNKMNSRIFTKDIEGSQEGLYHFNVTCAHLSGFRVVVEPGYDLYKSDGYNITALNWALFLGQTDMAKDLLKKGARVNLAQGDRGSSPLVAATVNGQADIVKYLLEHGAMVNALIGDNKLSPLHLAALKGRLECTKVLLKHGANISSVDTENATPLHYAVLQGHLKVAKKLVREGADVNARTNLGLTPLHIAVGIGNGNEGLVNFLIRSGADLNSKNNNGDTPLMVAAAHDGDENESLKIIKHLVENHKLDLNAKNNDGATAMSLAASKQHRRIKAYLRAHGAE